MSEKLIYPWISLRPKQSNHWAFLELYMFVFCVLEESLPSHSLIACGFVDVNVNVYAPTELFNTISLKLT